MQLFWKKCGARVQVTHAAKSISASNQTQLSIQVAFALIFDVWAQRMQLKSTQIEVCVCVCDHSP
jgi:hypothetical protein